MLPQEQENKENALNHASSFSAGAGTQETGSKRKGKRGKQEFLKGKCNQGLSNKKSFLVLFLPGHAVLMNSHINCEFLWFCILFRKEMLNWQSACCKKNWGRQSHSKLLRHVAVPNQSEMGQLVVSDCNSISTVGNSCCNFALNWTICIRDH